MLPDSIDSERAVSPVIGVILMVAITVTLAAVVGAFVMGVGDELMQPAPQANIEFSDADVNLTYSPDTDYQTYPEGNGQNILQIEHRGGDELDYSELKVVIDRKGGSPKYIERDFNRSGVYVASVGVHTTQVVWVEGPFASNESFATGERLVLTEADGEDVDISDGQYEVTIIHKPSNSIVDSQTITIE